MDAIWLPSRRISILIRHGKAASNAGGTEILTIPIRSFAVPNIISALEARGTRKYPIDAEKVWGPHTEVEELRLTLPAGWKAKLPASDTASSVFGTYVGEYTQNGQELADRATPHRRRRRVAGQQERRAAGVDEEDVGG